MKGAKIVEQKNIYHGFQSEIKVTNNSKIFNNNSVFKVGRYHSLKLKEPFNKSNFNITMRCKITNVAMAFENNLDKIYGFQFHPESFLTLNGNFLIKKILSA
jgi:anthranilate/para-aminobenzoate synthase component II